MKAEPNRPLLDPDILPALILDLQRFVEKPDGQDKTAFLAQVAWDLAVALQQSRLTVSRLTDLLGEQEKRLTPLTSRFPVSDGPGTTLGLSLADPDTERPRKPGGFKGRSERLTPEAERKLFGSPSPDSAKP